MCWHNSHKVRDSTGTKGKFANNKQQMKTQKRGNKLHLGKNSSVNNIGIKECVLK